MSTAKNLNQFLKGQSVWFWAHGTLKKGAIITIIEKETKWVYVITEQSGLMDDYIVEERHIMTIEDAIKMYKSDIKKAESYIQDLKNKLSPFITQQ